MVVDIGSYSLTFSFVNGETNMIHRIEIFCVRVGHASLYVLECRGSEEVFPNGIMCSSCCAYFIRIVGVRRGCGKVLYIIIIREILKSRVGGGRTSTRKEFPK